MKYSIKILTFELWSERKRLETFLKLSDEIMDEHPAIKETRNNIKDIERALKVLEEITN